MKIAGKLFIHVFNEFMYCIVVKGVCICLDHDFSEYSIHKSISR